MSIANHQYQLQWTKYNVTIYWWNILLFTQLYYHWLLHLSYIQSINSISLILLFVFTELARKGLAISKWTWVEIACIIRYTVLRRICFGCQTSLSIQASCSRYVEAYSQAKRGKIRNKDTQNMTRNLVI